jgi:DNA-binding response OmpR family regulator
MYGVYVASADNTSPDFLRMTLELGAACCLRKPFTPQALLAAINGCLEKQMVPHLKERQK